MQRADGRRVEKVLVEYGMVVILMVRCRSVRMPERWLKLI
jgi:hypothetical protein